MSINTTEILNTLLDTLNSSVDNVEFSLYFPNRKLSAPLTENYSATIGIKSDCVNAVSNQQTSVFYIELLSPIDSHGKDIFAKAVEITSALLDTDISTVQSCTIGDIEYITSQRAYRINITFTLENQFDENVHIAVDNSEYSCILISEKSLYTACDIKVYGQSKPIDTILSAYEYVLSIKLNNSAELPQNGFQIKTGKYKYLNCFIKSVKTYENYSEYEIISKERLAI